MESEDVTVFDVYEQLYQAYKNSLERELEDKHAELIKLVYEFRGLTSPMAREIANAEMERVEARIAEIRSNLEPLGDLRQTWLKEADNWHDKVEAARRSMSGEDERRRAEEVRKVIGKITCHFEYRQHGQQSRSYLSRLDIETVEGESATFRNAFLPGPG